MDIQHFFIVGVFLWVVNTQKAKKLLAEGGATPAEYADPLGEGIQHALIVVVLLGL
jgi:hypothetical protein